jgi:sortase A
VLAYVSLALWSSARFQVSETKRFEVLHRSPATQEAPRPGDPFGKISIPRLGLSAIISEGVDDRTLRHAVGHFPESSTPERDGNVALAGHRDTFFRDLAHIRVDDVVTLETLHGKYQYQVMRTEVVSPQHTELVQSSSKADLTLVTCFPFRYIGQAPQRFIVQATRIRDE